MDSYQSFLLSCLEESLKLLLKVIYLNDVIYDISITAKVHMDIILSYFFQCHNCKNFFNEEDVRKCQCREWCKFCARMNIHFQECSNCDCEETFEHKPVLNCIFPKCKENANFGNLTQALYCVEHVSSSITVSHYIFCDEPLCNKPAIYYDKQISCEKHKSEESKILFKEGKKYKSVYTKICDVCECAQAVIYTCKHCNMNRCSRCANLDMFVLNTESSTSDIYCCNCIHNYELSVAGAYSFDTCIECEKCYKEGVYIDNNYLIYCEIHKNDTCIDISEGTCEYNNCYAPCTIKNIFCRFHIKESNRNI